MRDKTRCLVNNIGLAAFADLNLRNNIPNECEIHLPDDNAVFRSNAGHGYRHIRLRFIDEIDWPIIDFVGHGLNECGLLRMIGVARDDIRRFSGHTELLASRRIQLHDFGQCRHLAHQPHSIKLPFIECTVVQRKLGFPRQSRRDLVEELADLVRRGLCLLALNTK